MLHISKRDSHFNDLKTKNSPALSYKFVYKNYESKVYTICLLSKVSKHFYHKLIVFLAY